MPRNRSTTVWKPFLFLNMKSKQRKSEELGKLKEKLPKTKITVFTSFAKPGEKGLSVAQATQLKRLLRFNEAEYFVTKKTLMVRGLKNYDGMDVYGMSGSLGLVLGYGNPYDVAKKVYEFAKKNPAMEFYGAIMDNAFISKEKFLEIAKLPSKEVLIGRLLGMLTYPMRGLAVVINEIAKKNQTA